MTHEEVLFEHAAVHTDAAAASPPAGAFVARGEWIVAVGDRAALRDAFPHARRVDLGGVTVFPAFTDSHIHLAAVGLALRSVDLSGARSLRDAVATVADAARTAPPDGWLRGRGWDKNLWPEGRFPGRDDLDPVTGGRPAVFRSKDGHAAWVNSAALARAGIAAATPDPEGGVIVRDPATREPTGLLTERAIHAVTALAETASPEAIERAIGDATRAAHRGGIGAVHVVEDGEVFAALQRLHARGRLGLRVCMAIPEESLDAAIRVGLRTGFGDSWLRVGGVKIFADGALGSQTASMLDPYEGQPENRGVIVRTRDQLRGLACRAASHGIAVTVHAIGDRANRWVLDAIEAARRETPPAAPADEPPRTLRHRIEHVQVLHPDDLPRLARLGVTASMQPIHCTQDRDIVDRYWGERGRYAYAFRSLLRRGTHLAFGSDAPVETLDVLTGIYAAVTRKRPEEPARPAWRPEEALTIHEAVHAYTEGAAYAAGEERAKGRLASGYAADFVGLSEDLYAVPPERIPDVRVRLTAVGGVVRYLDSSASS
ncbi:MAG TPA: amidohydrolase [bacterium]|nr:amidohydrolase [bacterium]